MALPRCVIGIDPGPIASGYVLFSRGLGRVISAGELMNDDLLVLFGEWREEDCELVIEEVVSHGMPVGASVFETVFWSGRFADRAASFGIPWTRRPFVQVATWFCRNSRAREAHVRQVLLDRFGGTRKAAVGSKRAPGPLRGVQGHAWSALAVALSHIEIVDELERARARLTEEPCPSDPRLSP